MNENERKDASRDDAQALCATIRSEADRQATDIIRRAREEAERLGREAAAEAERRSQESVRNLDHELEKTKDRIFSTLNLEKKRITFAEQTRLVDKIIAQATEQARRFRTDPAYARFLEQAVREGAAVVDKETVHILHAPQDRERLAAICGTDPRFVCRPREDDEIGVIISAADGSVVYDNRFSARLKRQYENIYMQLLKESSQDE